MLDKESDEPFGQEEVDGTEDEVPLLSDVRMAQRMGGGPLWLASRTRPAHSTSRVAALATSRPFQGLVFKQEVLRYLAGSRGHGLLYPFRAFDQDKIMAETSAEASHEDVGTQTCVCVFVHGCCIDWRSVRQCTLISFVCA